MCKYDYNTVSELAREWLENLKACAEETNAMFGTSISVDWRDDLKQKAAGTAF